MMLVCSVLLASVEPAEYCDELTTCHGRGTFLACMITDNIRRTVHYSR